tara:strand:+ start:1387 stop:3903 length:2517 start_codon:yes stop_codon:yes gene_type:complete
MSFGDLKVQDLIYEDSSNNEITVVIADLAPKNNPTFTGTVIIPTAPASDVSTKAASTAFVDAYYATKASPTFTGSPTVPGYAPLAGAAFTGAVTGTDLTLSGNLVVNGTTTTINTQTLDVEDKNIVIGKVSTPSDTTADGGGITLKGASDKTFNWVNATDAWTSSEHIHLGDNKKLILGVGTDLSIWSDGDNNKMQFAPASTLDIGNTTVPGIISISSTHINLNKIVNVQDSDITIKKSGTTKVFWHDVSASLTFANDVKLKFGGVDGTSGQVLTSGGSGASPSWAAVPAGGNTFTAVANGSIANNKAVRIQTDGKVSEIKETSQNRSVPAGVVSAGQAFPINDANNTGGNIRADRKSTVVYDSDKGRIIIIWGESGYLRSRVGTPNKTTGVVTWGNVISLNSSDNFKAMSAVYDTTADKVIVFAAKDNSPSRLEGYVGTVASSGNSVTWSSAVSPGNGEIRYCASAFDSTTGRTIVMFQDVASGGCKFEICYINSGTLTWHTGDTANNNMISTDMFGSATNITHFDVCSVDSSKWLFCCAISTSPPSGFTQYALYAKIINASTNTTAAPTYANAGAKQIETASSTQRGNETSVAWDPTLEKIMYTWKADPSGSETNFNHFGMLCYFNAGKTDITVNNATYNVGGSGNTSDLHQLSYDSGSGRFMFTIEDYGGVRGSFLTCGGTGNNTLTVSGRGTVVSPNPDNFGTSNKHDLIDITGGYMFSFYGNQLASSSAINKTITSIIATQEMATNLTDANQYVGFADQAYSDGQTATIKTYGNNAETLTSLTAGTTYYVQGDGSIATSWDSSGLSSFATNTPVAGTAISASKLLIRDPLAKT